MGKQDFGLDFLGTISLVASQKLNNERVKAIQERFGTIKQQVNELGVYIQSEGVDVAQAETMKNKIVEDLGTFVKDFDLTCQSIAEVSDKLGLG